MHSTRDRIARYGMRICIALAIALHAHTSMSSGWTTEETRALVGVWGQANECPERARWNGAEPLHLRKNLLSLEILSGLCVLRNRRKAHSNTSSTATRRGTIDSRDVMASGLCDCTNVHAHRA